MKTYRSAGNNTGAAPNRAESEFLMIMPLPDELWTEIEDLLPLPTDMHAGRLSDRRAVEGIIFVLRARIGWNALPASLASGSAATLYRRLQFWQNSGAWPAIEALLRERLPDGANLDWARLKREAPGPSAAGARVRAAIACPISAHKR